jgi:AI-2E family transporter
MTTHTLEDLPRAAGSDPKIASQAPPASAPVAAEVAEEVTPEPEPARMLLHMPVDIRSMSLVVLAILASLFVLHWAKAVFVPVMLGILFSYALSPIVNWMERRRIPRWLSAAVLLFAILGGTSATVWSLRGQATQLVEALPAAHARRRGADAARDRAEGGGAAGAGRPW